MESGESVEGKIKLPSGSFSEKALDALADISERRNNNVLKEEPPHIIELRDANLIRGRTRLLRDPIYVVQDQVEADSILSEYRDYMAKKNNPP